MPKKKSSKKPLYLFILTLIAIASVVFILEKTNIINLYSERSNGSIGQADTKTVNSIDYSPATSTDNDDINNKKANGTVDQEPEPITNDTSIQITFIANAQDTSGGQLEVRTLLSGVTDGDCYLTLTKGSAKIEKTSDVVQQNTYFICEAYIVPYSELSNGDWTIKLKVTSGDGRTNVATTTTTVN